MPSPDSMPAPLLTMSNKLLERVKNTLSPRHYVSQFKEDWSAFLHAIRTSRLDLKEHNVERIHDLFRGRFIIAMFVSGPFNMVAVALVQILQYAKNSPYISLALPVVSFALTGFVFQLVWRITNRDLYKLAYNGGWARFRAFERDLWPVHVASVQYTLIFWTLNLVIGGTVIRLFDLKNQAAAHNIPWTVILTTFELFIVSGPFVRNMGDFFERHSGTLAKRYLYLFDAS